MKSNEKAAFAAPEDVRRKTLLPGMAQELATSPVNLLSPLACHDLLVRHYKSDDVLALLSQAIIDAHAVRNRAA